MITGESERKRAPQTYMSEHTCTNTSGGERGEMMQKKDDSMVCVTRQCMCVVDKNIAHSPSHCEFKVHDLKQRGI